MSILATAVDPATIQPGPLSLIGPALILIGLLIGGIALTRFLIRAYRK